MEPMVSVKNVSMRFNMATERVDNLKEYVIKFFKGNLQFSNKVCLAVRILRFSDICADGSAASSNLIGNDGFSFLFQVFDEVNNGYCKVHGLRSQFTI